MGTWQEIYEEVFDDIYDELATNPNYHGEWLGTREEQLEYATWEAQNAADEVIDSNLFTLRVSTRQERTGRLYGKSFIKKDERPTDWMKEI